MESPSLSTRFREAFPEFAALEMRDGEDFLELGSGRELAIRVHQDGWILESPEGHEHFETAADAMELAALVLRGDAWFVEEFRGEVLARTWIEANENESFESGHTAASFLCPFDADEWELWPGEEWRQIRTTRVFNPVTVTFLTDKTEEVVERSEGQESEMLQWLETGLGPAEEGMRWTVGEGPRFVFQVPRHWRRTERSHGEVSWLDFAGEDPTFNFRVQRYFREADNPLSHPDPEASRATSIEFTQDDSDPSWAKIKWTLMFTDGEWDMMGIFELFYPKSEEERGSLFRSMIDASARKALYVPEEWNMTGPD